MAAKHDMLVSRFRARLRRRSFRIEHRSPFVDYKPDISASKKNTWVFVEVEVDETLNSNHTIGQLEKMHKYVVNNSPCSGILVVPGGTRKRAEFLIESIFESKKIKVVGLY